LVIGDAISDVQAARAAGATPIFVLSGLGEPQELQVAGLAATLTLPDLASAVDRITLSLWPAQPLA
jgi:phosphoglycolate phosphatase-like HAD superfamily hydrolase